LIKYSCFKVNHEPPYTEPYVRWCGRTAGVSPPPTRYWDVESKDELFNDNADKNPWGLSGKTSGPRLCWHDQSPLLQRRGIDILKVPQFVRTRNPSPATKVKRDDPKGHPCPFFCLVWNKRISLNYIPVFNTEPYSPQLYCSITISYIFLDFKDFL